MHYRHYRNRQTGAALIVGLVLLLVLTVLGVSGMNMSTLELQMAGNSQAQQLAFQAAETGVDVALSGPVSTTVSFPYSADVGSAHYDSSIACAATTDVPDGAYSSDESARAIHFDTVSTGTQAARNAVVVITQSVYIVGPAPGNSNFNPGVSPGSC
jgi:type IV pilus assembly protein PilX